MENIGALSLLIALCLAIYSVLGSLVGAIKKRPFLITSAERAVYAVWMLLTVASGILINALMTGDFRIAYVAAHSNRTMPAIYKFTAWWGGQEGSLLLWAWLLSCYAAIVVYSNPKRHLTIMPYVNATMKTNFGFFILL